MLRVLVLGASGMLGHKLLQMLDSEFEIAGTVQNETEDYADFPVLNEANLFPQVRVQQIDSTAAVMDAFKPAAVINCIGIVKQVAAAKDPLPSITVNALFPHQLARLCQARDVRLVHFSTDCVFSGRSGPYTEADISDAEDLYGRTKFLGEIPASPGCLTLRTSIIGHELRRHTGLIDWFVSQRGARVKGFSRALYTGVTTRVLARLIGKILIDHPSLEGLWQVASAPISKFDLLSRVNAVYDLGIQIEREGDFVCDRRLDGSRFQSETGLRIPDWEEMVIDMSADRSLYPAVNLRSG